MNSESLSSTVAVGFKPARAKPKTSDAGEPTLELPAGDQGLPLVWLRLETGVPAGGGPAFVPLAPGEELLVGSGPSADLRVDDATVSALHCQVVHAGDAIDVTDLGSRNGVRVGGLRVGRASLVAGSSFDLGRTTVHIELGSRPSIEEPPLPELVGQSRAMRVLASAVRRASPLRLPVLLRGESGTGKDLVARAVHDESPRSTKPFVVLNAATISRELAESELFGHQRGAFTGAVKDRRGAFREAHQGTLFLDEVAALSLDVQAKLLRAVEEGVVRPLGAETGQVINVRLIAATCEPLEQMVAERRFRADLYERLAVCVIRVPPLRDRPDDIPALARHLMKTSELGARELSAGALAVLRAQRWPGNVRELRNVIVQAAVRSDGPILAEHVASVLAERASAVRRRIAPEDAMRLFEDSGRNVSAAARRADLPRSTMRDLLRVAGARPARPIERGRGARPSEDELV